MQGELAGAVGEAGGETVETVGKASVGGFVGCGVAVGLTVGVTAAQGVGFCESAVTASVGSRVGALSGGFCGGFAEAFCATAKVGLGGVRGSLAVETVGLRVGNLRGVVFGGVT